MIGTRPREISTKTQGAGATTLLQGKVEVVGMREENERLKALVVQLTEIILRTVVGRK